MFRACSDHDPLKLGGSLGELALPRRLGRTYHREGGALRRRYPRADMINALG